MGRGESRAAAWQGAKFENKVTSAIQRLGYPVVNDVYLPIGCGGRYTQIDHVASVGALVVAVESKNWAGSVRGRAADGHWRISGRRDWTAQNPLRQNEIHVAAVVQALGGEATGLVVVSDAASFVTGVPAGVARFADLERALKALERSHPGSRATGARWEKFARLCASVDRRVGERGHAALLSGRK
jgi:hypothetical protein